MGIDDSRALNRATGSSSAGDGGGDEEVKAPLIKTASAQEEEDAGHGAGSECLTPATDEKTRNSAQALLQVSEQLSDSSNQSYSPYLTTH